MLGAAQHGHYACCAQYAPQVCKPLPGAPGGEEGAPEATLCENCSRLRPKSNFTVRLDANTKPFSPRTANTNNGASENFLASGDKVYHAQHHFFA